MHSSAITQKFARLLQQLGLSAATTHALTGSAVSIRDLSVEKPTFGERLSPPYFHGVYQNLAHASGGEPNPYDSTAWVETAAHVSKTLLASRRSKRLVIEAHLLPVATLICALGTKQESVRVLDFGGGTGDNYLQVNAVLEPSLARRVDYRIVDTPRNCEEGEELLSKCRSSLRFHRANPEHGARFDDAIGAHFDIVLLCGTLMYIDGWKDLLRDLGSRVDAYMYVTRTPTNVSVPTFYVRQLLVPSIGPWAGKYIGSIGMAVINHEDIKSLLAQIGLERTFFAPLFAYDPGMSAFPAPYNAIIQTMSLFARR